MSANHGVGVDVPARLLRLEERLQDVTEMIDGLTEIVEIHQPVLANVDERTLDLEEQIRYLNPALSDPLPHMGRVKSPPTAAGDPRTPTSTENTCEPTCESIGGGSGTGKT